MYMAKYGNKQYMAMVQPKDYIELESISSTGTQYIKTGLYLNTAETSYDISINIEKGSALQAICGTRNSLNTTSLMLYYNTSGQVRLDCNGSSSLVSAVVSGNIDIKQSSLGTYVNDIFYARTYVTSTVTGQPFGIFADPNFPTAYPATMKLYKFTARTNGVTVMNLIPVQRKSDSVVCMYDTISAQYFENAGTGDFVAEYKTHGVTFDTPGYYMLKTPPVTDVDAYILDYIEGTGIQYIDTGMTISDFTPVEFAVTPRAASSTAPLFGARNSTTSVRCNIWQISSEYRLDWLDSTSIFTTYGPENGVKNVFELSQNSVKIDGVENTNTAYDENTDYTTLNCHLFDLADQSGAVDSYTKYLGCWHYYKRWNLDKTQTVQDFIPITLDKDVSNGSIGDVGMWDLVNGVFYPNSGTGNFIGGSRVGYIRNGQPFNMDGTPYRPDAYILNELEIVGSRFNTNFYPTENSTVDCKISINADQPYADRTYGHTGLFGVRHNGLTWNCFNQTNATLRVDFNSFSTAIGATYPSRDEYFTLRSGVDGTTRTVYINDELKSTSVSSIIGTSTKSAAIGNFWSGSSLWGNTCMKIAYWNYLENGEVTNQYIPVEQADGTVCLYDVIDNSYNLPIGNAAIAGTKRIGYICNNVAYNMDGTEMFLGITGEQA